MTINNFEIKKEKNSEEDYSADRQLSQRMQYSYSRNLKASEGCGKRKKIIDGLIKNGFI